MATDATAAARDAVWGQLMAAAQDGDRHTYEKLLREVTPFVRALARRHCRNAADVEEMVQDTLLTVHRVRHTYDPHRPFSPWLAAIASRRIIDTLRRRLRTARHEVVDEQSYETFAAVTSNSDLEAVHSTEEINNLLACLPPRQRLALEALKLREMSLIEAAAVSGLSVGALKVNVHRALKTLRALVRERDRT